MNNLQFCVCKITGSSSNMKTRTSLKTITLENEKLTWERDFRFRYRECPNCGKIKEVISRYLIRDRVYWKNHNKTPIHIKNSTKHLLNSFKNRDTITARKVINFLPGNYISILTKLWKKGIIRIHRTKDNPNIVIPSEHANEIPKWIYLSIIREGFSLKSISLTDDGRNFLASQLKWEPEKIIMQQAKTIYETFFNMHKEPVTDDERLIHLYNFLKNNHESLLKGEVNVFYDDKENELVRFDPKFNYFILTLRVLIEIFGSLSDSKIINPPYLAKKMKLSIKDIRYIRLQLEKILKIQPVFFNFPRSDLPSESNPLTIPMEVQNILADFEIHLRDFLINVLLANESNNVSNFFPPKMLRKLRKDAIKEMKESKKTPAFIQCFKSSNLLNKKDLIWIFEQMSCSHYIKFIDHNLRFLGKYFKNFDYKNDLRTYYGKFRNIKAHIKTKAERDISTHLGVLYGYEKVFSGIDHYT